MQKQQIKIEDNFESKCAQAFICPITNIVMQDPYMDANGISYQKQAIFEWVRKTGRHPTAGRQMKLQQLNANLTLKNVINEYKQKFKDQISYQISRNKFEENPLRKQRASIEEAQQMVESKQQNLESLRKTASQSSIKLQEQSLQIEELKEALKRSKQQYNQIKNKLKQRQQQLQQLNQKNQESKIKESKIKEKNLIEQLAVQTGYKASICPVQKKTGAIKKSKFASTIESKYSLISSFSQQKKQLRRVKITPEKQSRGLKTKTFVIDDRNSNVCIKNDDSSNQWLCSSPLPFDGEFVFTIKVIKLTGSLNGKSIFNSISFGVMENDKKENIMEETYNYSVCLIPYYQQVSKPNEKQTHSQCVKCSCSSLFPKYPFQIECHVNRQQNTIAWHYANKQQAKAAMPNAWKINKKQLCAIVFLNYRGNILEMM